MISRSQRRRISRCLVVPALLMIMGCGQANLPRGDAPIANVNSDTDAPHRDASAADSIATISVVRITPRESPPSLTDKVADKYDAQRDDWDTEVLNDATGAQLKLLAKLIEHPKETNPAKLASIADDVFRCVALRPAKLETAFKGDAISVQRWKPEGSAYAFQGAEGLGKALDELVAPFGESDVVYVKFKQFKIEKTEEAIRTRVYFESNYHGAKTSGQQTATWDCEWTFPQRGDRESSPPKLTSIRVAAYEEASFAPPTEGVTSLFADCTESILGGNAAYREQVVPPINHWLSRIGREFMGQFGQHGMAIGDVNGDGLDDLYVCDAGGLPNRLYLHQPDGTAIDASSESGVDLLEDSVGALLIDLDNDGDQDLVVATDPWLQFAENDGQGHFKLRRGYNAYSDIYSLSAADFDNDGDLDLYACGYNARRQDPFHRGLPFPLPYHDAENGGANVLLRNEGEFVFADATAESGLDANNHRFSLSASWEDFDNDGDSDLYVANDFGRNCLYRNDAGQFTDVAAESAVEDHASGMSVSWGDYNRDGWMDVYVSNMFSAAGNRVTYQRQFADGLTEQTTANVQRMARGNTLFANQGESGSSVFQDVSESAAVTMGRWAWASRFMDLNNDGWQDIVVANGYVTNEDNRDL